MRSQRFHRQAKRAVHCLTRAWYATSNFFKEVWRGDADEPQKIILHRDLGHVLRRFLIHLLPLGATIVLAYFNFAGYFIGNNFQGRTGEEYQALDLLCLQVAAKLLVRSNLVRPHCLRKAEFLQELLIVASLGTIVLDVIRTQLVFGSSGLPLGLLSSKQSFPQVQYLLSPEFRFGLGGLTIRKRLLFGLLILTSTVIALLAGPSAALLMIPTRKDSWPAGAASIWLKGDESTLWPSKVTGDDIGGPVCESPGSQVLTSYQLNFSGCVWAGSPYLAAAFRQIHFNIPRQLSIDDGLLKRDMIIRQRGDVHDTHVLTSHLSAGILSKLAGNRWYDALLHTHHSSKHYTLRYRARNLTMGITQSWLPAVRTRCRLNDPLSQNGSDVLMVCFQCNGCTESCTKCMG